MQPVFNVYAAHEYDRALGAWADPAGIFAGLPEYRALAINLRYEHRISKQRQAAFDSFVDRPCTANELQKALKRYHETRMRPFEHPDFLDETLNRENVIDSYPKSTYLVRLLRLNGLTPIYLGAEADRKEVFRYYPVRGTEQEIAAWLDAELKDKPAARVHQFIKAVFDEMNYRRRERCFQPSWVTLWDWFERSENDDADRWLEVLGSPKRSFPEWVVLLRYSIDRAGKFLVRPTQLDAGWFAHHFPSPPYLEIASGGRTLDLAVNAVGEGPKPEFIHEHIEHRLEDFRSLKRTTGNDQQNLQFVRHRHHHRLAVGHAAAVFGWMPESATIPWPVS